jgi:hypothetical protein
VAGSEIANLILAELQRRPNLLSHCLRGEKHPQYSISYLKFFVGEVGEELGITDGCEEVQPLRGPPGTTTDKL